MIRCTRLLAAVVTLAASSSLAQAQTGVFVGAMGSMPMGKYGDYANLGWMVMAGGSRPVTGGEIRVDGQLGMNSHESVSDGFDASTTLIGAMARYIKPLGSTASGFRRGPGGGLEQQAASSTSPYLHAGGGILLHKYNPPAGIEGETDSQIVLSFGGGLRFGKALFGEAAYNHGLDDTTFLSFGLGFRFGGK